MSNKPIFVATHPRACSTAFERVFMTRRDILQCVHEPFGDAYYFGPERLHPRYEEDEKARLETGFGESTYRSIFEKIERENTEGKRIFIKDMAQYWIPPDGNPASIAPSLVSYRRGVGTDANGTQEANGTNGVDDTKAAVAAKNPPYPYDTAAEPNNPTVVPEELLKKFHFTFLIRHPSSSIPSYYRCTIPPLDAITGFYNFMPSEAGYGELRRLFDYLRSVGHVNSHIAGQANGVNGIDGDKGSGVDVCVIDADDLLDNPSGIIETFCNSVGIDYNPSMLKWDNDEDHRVAKEAFEKWKGFHEDAIDSTELKPRKHKKVRKSEDELYAEWKEKYGEEGANVIRDTVRASVDDYNYLKQFAVKV